MPRKFNDVFLLQLLMRIDWFRGNLRFILILSYSIHDRLFAWPLRKWQQDLFPFEQNLPVKLCNILMTKINLNYIKESARTAQ